MDKNMIHIDDLIRQRLIGEEEERAGAWLRMKDMLDKNIPTRAPAGYNWRRMFTYAAIVAAVATVGIGGYQVTDGFRESGSTEQVAMNNAAQGGENTPLNNHSTVTATEATATNDQASEAAPAATTVNATANNANSYTAKTTAPANQGNTTTGVRTDAKLRPADNAAAVAKVNTPNSTTNNTSNNSANNNNSTNTAPVQTIASNVTVPQQKTTASGPSANDADMVAAKDKVEMQTVSTVNQNNRVSVNPFTGEAKVISTTTPGTAEIPVVASTQPTPAVQNPEQQKKENVFAANTPNASVPTAATTTAPQASAPDGGGSDGGSNSNHSAGKNRNSGWDFRWFNDMLDKAEYQLGNTKVNTGIMGGINTTFGNYDMRGFNVGLFALFSFADGPWSMMVQARYSQFFNNRINTYSDNYTNYVQGSNGQFAQEEKEHFFKYSTASSVNMPLMLQYTPYKSKFTIFGGADMNYYFKINAEETERTLTSMPVPSAQQSGVPLTLNDFNSRFGIGAVLGVGYNINDMMRLDVRMTKSMWDNAKTPGAQRISNDLYKTPNLQLNLGVRLGKDKKDQQ